MIIEMIFFFDHKHSYTTRQNDCKHETKFEARMKIVNLIRCNINNYNKIKFGIKLDQWFQYILCKCNYGNNHVMIIYDDILKMKEK